jgi:integrase
LQIRVGRFDSGPRLHPSSDLWAKPLRGEALQNLSAVSTAFIACCAKAGMTGLRLHDLRAEGVSRLSERGFDLGSIKAISGHKSMIVLRYLRPGDAETLAARLA